MQLYVPSHYSVAWGPWLLYLTLYERIFFFLQLFVAGCTTAAFFMPFLSTMRAWTFNLLFLVLLSFASSYHLRTISFFFFLKYEAEGSQVLAQASVHSRDALSLIRISWYMYDTKGGIWDRLQQTYGMWDNYMPLFIDVWNWYKLINLDYILRLQVHLHKMGTY